MNEGKTMKSEIHPEYVETQVTWVSLYSGWISGFMVIPYIRVWVSLLSEPNGRLTDPKGKR